MGAARVAGRSPFFAQDAITMAMLPSWADTSRAKAELGFAPEYPTVEDGIESSV